MNCADVEILICDYQDGTLTAERKSAGGAPPRPMPGVRRAGAGLGRGSRVHGARRAQRAPRRASPELITRILFEAPWSKDRSKPKGARSWMSGILGPILQPRFAMGMAMTILSLALLARFMAPVRQLRMSDLEAGRCGRDRGPRPTGPGGQYGTRFANDNLKFVYQNSNHPAGMQQQGEDQQSAPVRRLRNGKRTTQSCQSKATPEGCPLGPAPRAPPPVEGQLRIPRGDPR